MSLIRMSKIKTAEDRNHIAEYNLLAFSVVEVV